MNESYHTYAFDVSNICMSGFISKGHVTHMNESWHGCAAGQPRASRMCLGVWTEWMTAAGRKV